MNKGNTKLFFLLVWFLVLGFCSLSLSSCTTIPAKKSSDPTQVAMLEPAALLKFPDVPIPSTFRFVENESYAFQSSNFRAALLKYTGKALADQVVAFYKEQMPMYNWNLVNIVEYGRRMLSFEKEQENCVVTVEDRGSTSDMIISIAPKSQAVPRKVENKPIK